MPELPEVETTANYLRDNIVGKVIAQVEILWDKTLSPLTHPKLIRWLPGARIEAVLRRGKFIVMEVRKQHSSSQACILAHMRMSGSFDVVSSAIKRGRHERFILKFSNGRELRFDDPRKFGRIYVVSDHSIITTELGVEPFDETLSADRLYAMLQEKSGAIKPLLLNQSFLAGIGNIYADESLWRSRIHPLTKAHKIPYKSAKALLSSMRAVLSQAIRRQGTDNGDGVVEGGMYRPRVYGRGGKPCSRCNSAIKKIVVGQRGTHFCPRCQKKR